MRGDGFVGITVVSRDSPLGHTMTATIGDGIPWRGNYVSYERSMIVVSQACFHISIIKLCGHRVNFKVLKLMLIKQ